MSIGVDRGGARSIFRRPQKNQAFRVFLFIGGLELVITASVLEVLQVEEGREREYYAGVARTPAEIFLNGLAKEGA